MLVCICAVNVPDPRRQYGHEQPLLYLSVKINDLAMWLNQSLDLRSTPSALSCFSGCSGEVYVVLTADGHMSSGVPAPWGLWYQRGCLGGWCVSHGHMIQGSIAEH